MGNNMQREDVLSVLASIASDCLSHGDLESIIAPVLASLGEVTGVSHVSLFAQVPNSDTPQIQLRGEWFDSTALPGHPALRLDCLSLSGEEHWLSSISRGEILSLDRAEAEPIFGSQVPALLDAFLLVPFLREQRFYGFLTFAQDRPIDWSSIEIDLMRLAAELFASALSHEQRMLDTQLAQAVFQAASEGIVVTDAAYRIISVNPAFTSITGFSASECVGRSINILRSGYHNDEFYSELKAMLVKEGQWQGEVWSQRKSGELFPEWLSVKALSDAQGQVHRYIGVISDISALKDAHALVEHLAMHDSLTGLANRHMFTEELERQLAYASRTGGELALLFIDLDGFKLVNDTLGHPTGDKLLKAVAASLKAILRKEDLLARMGGDEFVLLVKGSKRIESIAAIARKVLRSLRDIAPIEGNRIELGASIGIALYPADGVSSDVLIRHADMAMYRAKENGKNQFHFYESHLAEAVAQRYVLEQELRSALEQRQFEVYYQPQLNVEGNALIGVEALLRWQHPQRGVLSPGEFLAVALSTGLAYPLFETVFEEVCRFIHVLDEKGIRLPKVSINIAGIELLTQGCREMVMTCLRDASIEPERIEFEVTESLLMRSLEDLADTLDYLRQQGVQISIDDFGTGYSSLSRLRDLPIDMLKIDKSFVHGIAQESSDEAIVRAIISMARSLRLNVIAEGIETAQQTEFLLEEGCKLMQGFLHGRPMSGDDLMEQIQQARYLLA
jgi:diguanylate cyclase (GGDEF)-like protein/PAS domain S-box-containing protein